MLHILIHVCLLQHQPLQRLPFRDQKILPCDLQGSSSALLSQYMHNLISIWKKHRSDISHPGHHRWELPGNYPVFSMVMVIYHYVEIIWRILITPDFLYNIYNYEKYYPGEPVNINIRSLINIIQDKNRFILTKKGKGKLPLFCGNGERVILIYAGHHPSTMVYICL